MTTSKTDSNLHDEGLKRLADEFAKLEGRRPRVLVTLTNNDLSSQFNETSSCLADLGFDVDIAPRFNSFESLSRQAIENDVHALLVLVQDTSVANLIDNIIDDLKKYQRSDIIVLLKTNIITSVGEDVRNDGEVPVFGLEIKTAALAKFILKALFEKQ